MGRRPIASGKSSFDLVDAGLLFSLAGVGPGTRMLDLACGTGNYTLFAAPLVGETGVVYAVDLWEEGIAALREELLRRRIANVVPLVADVSRSLPVPPAGVDVCLMATVLHDLVSDGTDAGTIANVATALRPGGTLAVVEFAKLPPPPGPPLAVRLDSGEVAGRLSRHGLQLRTTAELGPFTYLALLTRT